MRIPENLKSGGTCVRIWQSPVHADIWSRYEDDSLIEAACMEALTGHTESAGSPSGCKVADCEDDALVEAAYMRNGACMEALIESADPGHLGKAALSRSALVAVDQSLSQRAGAELAWAFCWSQWSTRNTFWAAVP